MELGRVAEIDNAKMNQIEKAKKIADVNPKERIVSDEKYKNIQPSQVLDKNEVVLDNVKFGYNKKSQDFFVKITRGDVEHKYPTEDMMRVKAYLLQELDTQQNETK